MNLENLLRKLAVFRWPRLADFEVFPIHLLNAKVQKTMPFYGSNLAWANLTVLI